MDGDSRILASAKLTSTAHRPRTLRDPHTQRRGAAHTLAIATPRRSRTGTSEHAVPDLLAASRRQGQPPTKRAVKRTDAEVFVLELLEGGPVPGDEVRRSLAPRNQSHHLDDTARELGVLREAEGFPAHHLATP